MRTDNLHTFELYIHIPFCVRKCRYCDFLSFPTDPDIRLAYVESLTEEIKRSAGLTDRLAQDGAVLDTVFIGGGTPSLLTGDQIQRILKAVRDYYPLNKKAEISMEANPGTLTMDRLGAIYEAGVNRLSIGLQSTEDRLLRILGRIHTFDTFLIQYRDARNIGFSNINIDLMSGLPGQRPEDWKRTLETVGDLAPEHISAYSLILEEGTPFRDDPEILAALPDEEADREMYHMTRSVLARRGYERYEISNYAGKGFACRHNLGYWDGVPYLGCGIGAASYWPDENGKMARFSNVSDIRDYIRKPFRSPDIREDYQILSTGDRMEEYMFLGLRKMSGISIKRFADLFGRGMEEVYGPVIDRYLKAGLLYKEEDCLRLTEAGIDVSNSIFCDFLL